MTAMRIKAVVDQVEAGRKLVESRRMTALSPYFNYGLQYPVEMSIWRPPQEIRVKVIGLNWRGGRLLAAEVLDDDGRIKGVRPLGGSVEFGETLENAMIREFKEELNVDVLLNGKPFFLENIYFHEGSRGHEIIAVFEVSLPERAFDGCDRIEFTEAHGGSVIARWFDLSELDLGNGTALYPNGLRAHLLRNDD